MANEVAGKTTQVVTVSLTSGRRPRRIELYNGETLRIVDGDIIIGGTASVRIAFARGRWLDVEYDIEIGEPEPAAAD